jgi:protein-S-isoprenylcysteine O-methyltransferase Ste14
LRNPIRLKNLRLRFLPFFIAGAGVFLWAKPSLWGFLAGAVVVLLGVGVRTWGAGHLLKNDELTTSGPYAYVRNPLYAGTLLTAAGFALIAGGWFLVGLLLFVLPWFFLSYFPRKDRTESERLEELYGDAFRAYRDRVPALIPRLRSHPGDVRRGTPRVSWSGERYSENNELGTLLAQIAGLACFAALTLYHL